jgi:radical SAM protein with 4Fe4S-binding SPASM domain
LPGDKKPQVAGRAQELLTLQPVMDLPDILHIEAVGYGGLSGGKSRHAIPPHFIAFDAFKRVLDQFPRVRRLHIGGAGDPMLHPRFFDMVRHAAERGLEVSADSVLTGLSDARAEICVESGLRRLVVPADKGDVVLQRSLKRLQAAKQRLSIAFPEVQADKALAGGRCDRPWRAVYLSTACEVLPCDRAMGPKRPSFGNAQKEGVLRVWNREEFRAFRERLASDDVPEACVRCEMRNSPADFGENAAWSASTMPPPSATSSTTPPRPTAA